MYHATNQTSLASSERASSSNPVALLRRNWREQYNLYSPMTSRPALAYADNDGLMVQRNENVTKGRGSFVSIHPSRSLTTLPTETHGGGMRCEKMSRRTFSSSPAYACGPVAGIMHAAALHSLHRCAGGGGGSPSSSIRLTTPVPT
eukprot:TRINITY_DN4101_c0_g1_i2.p1 TRINITY_DN4101_c0_g1~~TRINITY_DN4101_c0_g1_i2.p1  ORF type:complete len:146 (-),score=7.94 TRINITY_DN4101_c0_g1_i2:146-583(-)